MCINLLVRFYGVTMHTNETSLKDLKVRRVLQKKKIPATFFFRFATLRIETVIKRQYFSVDTAGYLKTRNPAWVGWTLGQ